MSGWSHTVTFIVPIALVETAKRISRSLDPDVGGYDAFQMRLSQTGAEPATHAAYSTPARQSFIDTLSVISQSPVALKSAVDADYAVRWPSEVAPTLDECLYFLNTLQINIDKDFNEILEFNSLKTIMVN